MSEKATRIVIIAPTPRLAGDGGSGGRRGLGVGVCDVACMVTLREIEARSWS